MFYRQYGRDSDRKEVQEFMKNYTEAELQIIAFDAEDVITTSLDFEEGGDED